MAKVPEDDFMSSVDERQARSAERKKRPKTIPDAHWKRALAEAREMAAKESWAGARPIHFVAIHAVLFEEVYEFEPLDLTPATRMAACGMASALAKGLFLYGHEGVNQGEAAARVVAYVRWVWEREREREDWRRRNSRGGQTVGWRLVFGRSLLNEYANDARRKSKGASR